VDCGVVWLEELPDCWATADTVRRQAARKVTKNGRIEWNVYYPTVDCLGECAKAINLRGPLRPASIKRFVRNSAPLRRYPKTANFTQGKFIFV